MEQTSNQLPVIKPHPERWLSESFISRATLLGFIYLCVNVIYQEGYLSGLGIEFGFFSITRTLPIFDNFFVAAYTFLIWGVIVGISSSTYDQFFSFFNMVSWRDTKVAAYRFVSITFVVLFYIFLHFIYLQKDYWLTDKFFRPEPGTNGELALRLLWPTWGFLTWKLSILSILLAMIMFLVFNAKYRSIRKTGPQQLIGFNINWMLFHINAISPAIMVLASAFFLVILPAAYGKAMANISLEKVSSDGRQEIQMIEIKDTSTFCGERVIVAEQSLVWRKNKNDNFSIHLLGHWGDSTVFAKIYHMNTMKPSDEIRYNVCILSSSVVKTIIFSQDTIK